MKKTLLKSMLLVGMLAVGLGVQAKEDVTAKYVAGADLGSTTDWTVSGAIEGSLATDGEVNTIEFYHTWNSNAGAAIGNSKDFSLTQTITLPVGNYRIAVNAFYREGNGNGTNTKAYIFAGTKQQFVHAVTAAEQSNLSSKTGAYKDGKRQDDRGRAAYAFSIGDFSNEFDFTVEGEQGEQKEITIGFSGYIDTYCSWCILGPVKLYQYTLQDYLEDYDKKVTDEATPLLEKPMAASAKAALQAAANVDKSTLTEVAQVTAAIQALNEAIQNANNSIAAYEKIKAAIEKVATIDPELDLTAIWADYNEGKYQSADEIYPAFQKLEAAKLGTEPNTDYTKVIINPSFEWGNTDGWTVQLSGDTGARQNSNATFTVNNADGDYVFNTWSGNNGFPISQTIKGLPEGKYKMEALIATDAGKKVNLIGNNKKVAVDAHADGKDQGVYGEVEFNVTDGTAIIGAEGVDDTWYKVDDFQLTYLGELAVEDVEIAPESGDIAEALATATAYKKVGNITINLTKDAEYTVGASIEASANLIINGNGAIIDASTCAAPFVNYKSIVGDNAMKDETTPSDYVIVNQVKIAGVTVKGLANSIINNASGKKTLFKDVLLDDVVFELSGSKNVFALGTAYANNFTIQNSTIWSKDGQNGNFFKADGKPADVNAEETTTWTVNKSLLYNISVGNKANNSNGGIKGKKTTFMVLTNSILYNFGSKTGNEVNGWLWGQNGGANATYKNNVYLNADGVVAGWTDATKGGSDQSGTSIEGTIAFTDAAAGNFNGKFIPTDAAAQPEGIGDPRWTIDGITTGIATVNTNNELLNNAVYDLQGRRVAQPTKGLYIINGKKVIK